MPKHCVSLLRFVKTGRQSPPSADNHTVRSFSFKMVVLKVIEGIYKLLLFLLKRIVYKQKRFRVLKHVYVASKNGIYMCFLHLHNSLELKMPLLPLLLSKRFTKPTMPWKYTFNRSFGLLIFFSHTCCRKTFLTDKRKYE